MARKSFVGVLGLLPHRYSITGPGGEPMGTIDERFSLPDTFDVEVDDTRDVPRGVIVGHRR